MDDRIPRPARPGSAHARPAHFGIFHAPLLPAKQEGSCANGDNCQFAHNVFEYWLHPTRYRTQLCNDGEACKRWLCFFAHK